jgi:transposase-like protein
VIDARYEHVRIGGQVVSQGVLIVKGVREDGRRALLAVDVADTKCEAPYDQLFRRLKERGPYGVQFVTSGDHRGLVAATFRHFQGAARQRCYLHFLRNAGGKGKVARKHRKGLTSNLKAVDAVPQDKAWALELAWDVVELWSATHAPLARWIEDGI